MLTLNFGRVGVHVLKARLFISETLVSSAPSARETSSRATGCGAPRTTSTTWPALRAKAASVSCPLARSLHFRTTRCSARLTTVNRSTARTAVGRLLDTIATTGGQGRRHLFVFVCFQKTRNQRTSACAPRSPRSSCRSFRRTSRSTPTPTARTSNASPR